METYKINTFWSEKDKAFIAICPEFEGLAVVGKTRAKAVKEAEAAIQGYIEIYKEDGLPVPEPLVAPEYSGQVRLRMSNHVHRKAAEMAEAEGVSLNTYLNGAIEARNAVLQFNRELINKWNAAFSGCARAMISVHNEMQVTSNQVNIHLALGEMGRPLALESAAVETI